MFNRTVKLTNNNKAASKIKNLVVLPFTSLTLLLFCFAGHVLAQNINCSQYNSQVNQDLTQLNSILTRLNADNINYNECMNVILVESSNAYKTAVNAL